MEFSRGSVSLQFPFSCHLKVDVQQKLQVLPIEQCMFAYLEQASLETSSISRLNVKLIWTFRVKLLVINYQLWVMSNLPGDCCCKCQSSRIFSDFSSPILIIGGSSADCIAMENIMFSIFKLNFIFMMSRRAISSFSIRLSSEVIRSWTWFFKAP